MNRQSYVRIEHIFDIPVAQLRTCSFPLESKPFDTRLTCQSYKNLAQTFNLQEYTIWVPTELLIKACGGYKPPLPQAVPVQQRASPATGVRDNARAGRDNSHEARLLAWRGRQAAERNANALRRALTPQLNTQTPLLPASNILSWQVDRTRRQKEWNETAWRDLEANGRGPPPNDGAGSPLLHVGYLLGFVGIGIVGYLAGRALSKGLRSLVGGLARVVRQISIFRARAISSYTARSMVLSATAIMRGVCNEYITAD
jgi:hypothetical protein